MHSNNSWKIEMSLDNVYVFTRVWFATTILLHVHQSHMFSEFVSNSICFWQHLMIKWNHKFQSYPRSHFFCHHKKIRTLFFLRLLALWLATGMSFFVLRARWNQHKNYSNLHSDSRKFVNYPISFFSVPIFAPDQNWNANRCLIFFPILNVCVLVKMFAVETCSYRMLAFHTVLNWNL